MAQEILRIRASEGSRVGITRIERSRICPVRNKVTVGVRVARIRSDLTGLLQIGEAVAVLVPAAIAGDGAVAVNVCAGRRRRLILLDRLWRLMACRNQMLFTQGGRGLGTECILSTAGEPKR